MKKIVLVLIFLSILATGTAFAGDPRPDGFGIGIVAGGHRAYGSGASSNFGWDWGLALHALDIYWGIRASIGDHNTFVGVTADFLTLVGGNITGPLGWYIDAGLFAGVHIWDSNHRDDGTLGLAFGGRLPIGLNLNFDVVDIWLAIVPRIGAYVYSGLDIRGGIGPELGIRVWF